MFIPAHDAVVLYALESGSITESSTGDATTLPAYSTTPTLLGYTNLPQTARGLNNSKGFAIGQQRAAYNKRGRIEPTVSLEIRPGSVDALNDLLPDANGVLPYLTIYVAVKTPSGGGYTDIYRYCKPSTLDFKLDGGGDKGGGEISVSAELWAMAYERVESLVTSVANWRSDLRALGTPLMWHDVREFTINSTSYRRSLMSLSAKMDFGLERKNERPNWGDDKPLSRTCYALLEHHTNVSGEVALHERLPKSLFSGAAQAQDWGDIVVNCHDNNKGFTLTLEDAFPSDETCGGGESSAEIDHSVAFTADTLKVDTNPV